MENEETSVFEGSPVLFDERGDSRVLCKKDKQFPSDSIWGS